MNPKTGELVQVNKDLTGEEALRQGLVPIPAEDLERVMAMSDEERVAYAEQLVVRTQLPTGGELVQPVAPLMKRGLERRKERNRRKRERRARR